MAGANRTYFSWEAPGFDGSEMFYANTGSLELVNISLSSGADFNDLDFNRITLSIHAHN